MADGMSVDQSSGSSRSKKRRVDDVEDEAIDSFEPSTSEDTPAKRLRDRRGKAIAQQTLRFNAQALLNNLAFTKLFVTANYNLYSPATSPILLCVLYEHDILYRALCQTLPQLYQVAPTLRAVALIDDDSTQMEPLELAAPALERVLPVHSLLDLDIEVAEYLGSFLDNWPDLGDLIILLDATGICVWTSDNETLAALFSSRPDVEIQGSRNESSLGLQEVPSASILAPLMQHLQQMTPSDAMDQGA